MWDPVFKRWVDVLAALAGLAILWPIILVIMVAVRLTSQGPALLNQVRVGKEGRAFTLFKLRSMHVGTAQLPTHEVGAANLTPIGAFLRRWKLDELPQLWNVLRGDMSLVGPRPCLPTQTELIDARRASGALEVQPGITGLAQVNGIDMSEPQRLAEIDGLYARTRSFWGDMRLVFQTLNFVHKDLDPLTRSSGPQSRR